MIGRRTIGWGIANASILLVLLVADTVHAQHVQVRSAPSASAGAKASTPAPASWGVSEPDSDHASFVGAFAVGYLGLRELPALTNIDPAAAAAGVPNAITMTADSTSISAPVVGARYWISDLIGIDGGIGFMRTGGTIRRHYAQLTTGYEGDVITDRVSQWGVVVHGGVPFALHAEKHWVFEAIPEFNLGFSGGTQRFDVGFVPAGTTPPAIPNDVNINGTRFDIGGRVGTEIHFGFIGVPNLALEAGIGLYLSTSSVSAKGGGIPAQGATPGRPNTTYEESSTTVASSFGSSPWAVFTQNIAALYYF